MYAFDFNLHDWLTVTGYGRMRTKRFSFTPTALTGILIPDQGDGAVYLETLVFDNVVSSGTNIAASVQINTSIHQVLYVNQSTTNSAPGVTSLGGIYPINLLVSGSTQFVAALIGNLISIVQVDIQYLTLPKVIYDQIVSGALGAAPDTRGVAY